jgi:3-oxoacyl-[acyl-carrier protein] reductase
MSKLAVVSGGGTGIGAAIAGTLAADGYQVVIVGRRAEALSATASRIGPSARPVVADLTQVPDVERLAASLDGSVDVLVNNAGGFIGGGDDGLAGIAESWRRNYESNVLTAVLLTSALRDRLARPGGRVILLSSVAAQRGNGGPYSAAKAALHGWAYDLATELGPDGITVNVISPGYVADTEFFGDRMTQEGHQRRVNETLVKRAGRPADIAATVRYLVGPDSGYVTGQILNVNGGVVFGR